MIVNICKTKVQQWDTIMKSVRRECSFPPQFESYRLKHAPDGLLAPQCVLLDTRCQSEGPARLPRA